MPTHPMSEVLDYLRGAVRLPEGADPSDGQLLECFVSRRDPQALEALVRRHGPMVWGVCRRVLGHHHDAEDAFQATFLVLVRRAARIDPPAKVGHWLYGVAYQTALKARATRAKRKERECSATLLPEPAVTDPGPYSDLPALLDQEVSRLPEKYRTALVLCDLEGRTVAETARQLGCPEGTVASRLARARAMLAKRLARRGLATPAGTLAALLAEEAARASVPAALLTLTTRAAAGVVSADVALLTQGVMRAMFRTRMITVLGRVLALGLLCGVAALPDWGASGREKPAAPKPAVKARPGPREKDLAGLQGHWVVESEQRFGPKAPDVLLIHTGWTFFEGGKAHARWALAADLQAAKEGGFGAGTLGLTFTIDPDKKPKEITCTIVRNGGGKLLGLYELKKDTLKIAIYAWHYDKKRPRGFTARDADKDGSPLLVYVLKRKPAAKAGGKARKGKP